MKFCSCLIVGLYVSVWSCCVSGQAQEPSPAAQQAAEAAITESTLRADIKFLADDLLEGREAGTRGYQLATRYVATQFEALGLKPAGDDTGWYQALDLRRSVQVEEGCSLTLTSDTEAADESPSRTLTSDTQAEVADEFPSRTLASGTQAEVADEFPSRTLASGVVKATISGSEADESTSRSLIPLASKAAALLTNLQKRMHR